MPPTTQRTAKFPPKTLVKLSPVQVYTATFVDGEQFHDTRFVAVVGDRVYFLHPEGVDSKIKGIANWLRDKILMYGKSARTPTGANLSADNSVDPMAQS